AAPRESGLAEAAPARSTLGGGAVARAAPARFVGLHLPRLRRSVAGGTAPRAHPGRPGDGSASAFELGRGPRGVRRRARGPRRGYRVRGRARLRARTQGPRLPPRAVAG